MLYCLKNCCQWWSSPQLPPTYSDIDDTDTESITSGTLDDMIPVSESESESESDSDLAGYQKINTVIRKDLEVESQRNLWGWIGL